MNISTKPITKCLGEMIINSQHISANIEVIRGINLLNINNYNWSYEAIKASNFCWAALKSVFTFNESSKSTN